MKKGKPESNKSAKAAKKGVCYWFTGASGTGVRHALTALQKGFEDRGRKVQIISIEDELAPAFANYTHPTDSEKRKAYLLVLQKAGGFSKS